MATFPVLPDRTHPLFILAMDHRGSFEKLFGVDGTAPTPAELARMRTAKQLIFSGLVRAAPEVGAAGPGVLVDEQLGAQVLLDARLSGVSVAMPVEKSGQTLFGLEYGADTDAHLAEFEPDYVKVLVRMNPDDDPADIHSQLVSLAALSTSLHDQGRAFLYELLVPATDAQLSRAGGVQEYDRDVRPDLVAQVIALNQQAGVEPTLWKIEGFQTREAAEAVVAAAHADGRTADCIVLGRDAPQDRLDQWLEVASSVEGFVGFAVGRSIWEDAVKAHVANPDDEALVAAVAENYLHFVRSYGAAA